MDGICTFSRLWLISILFGILVIVIGLLSSCESSYSGMRSQPSPPKGNTSVSGTIVANAPVASLRSSNIDQDASDVYGVISYIPDLGLFIDGYNAPAHTFLFDSLDFQSIGEGIWESSFTCNGLSTGNYILSEFNRPNGDYGTLEIWELTTQHQTFTLESTSPAVIQPITLDLGGRESGYSCSGRILFEGNLSGNIELNLDASLNNADHSTAGMDCQWAFSIPIQPPQKVFFSIDNIKPEACLLNASAFGDKCYGTATRKRMNGKVSHRGKIDLTDPHPLDMYVTLEAYYDENDPPAEYIGSGTITCLIELTGALDWNSDIVVVAVDASKAISSRFSMCSRFILPDETGENNIQNVELRLLKPSTYLIDVFRTNHNSQTMERIGGIDTPVVLAMPIQEFDPYSKTYYTPSASTETAFQLEIPEGI